MYLNESKYNYIFSNLQSFNYYDLKLKGKSSLGFCLKNWKNRKKTIKSKFPPLLVIKVLQKSFSIAN